MKLKFKVGFMLLLGLSMGPVTSFFYYFYYSVLVNKVNMQRIIVILWKKIAIVWLDAQKCKPDCSFTSFWYMWWFTVFEKKSSFTACKCKCAYYHWGVGGKNCLHYLFTILSVLSLQRQTPLAYFKWEHCRFEINWPPLWPQKPHFITSRMYIQM